VTLPNIIRIMIDEKDGKSINLYFPTIVVFILLLPLLILAFPFWVLAVIILMYSSIGRMIRLLPFAVYELLCAAKGTDITVQNNRTDVVIRIY
jgi:hypothetical protein